jgi:WD40 repeat protein
VRVWDAVTGKERDEKFEGHRANVATVAVSSDGKLVATGGDDIRLWDPATGKQVRRIAVKGRVASVAFAPDNKILASAGTDKVLHLWDVETGQQVHELKGHKHALCGIAFSPDGKRLASGDVRSTIRLWDVAAGTELNHVEVKSITENLSLAFSPDSKTLACGGAWDDSSFLLNRPNSGIEGIEPKEGYFVLLWDAATGKELRRFAGLMDKIKSVAFAPDGKTLAAASGDGRVALWNAGTGQEHLYFAAHPNHVEPNHGFPPCPCIAFAPDGRTLASASMDKTIRLWDVATAKELGRFQSADGGFNALAFSPDGRILVSGSSDTTVTIWDVAAARHLLKPAKPEYILIGD